MRIVLARLARHAELLTYQRQRPEKGSERSSFRARCKLNPEAVFEVFFLIALYSLAGREEDTSISYSLTDPLPEQPELPDEQGRDVLLAGVLSGEEFQWRSCIVTLLCAAIFAGRAREAFFFMRQWAEVVLQRTSADKDQLYIRYVQFTAEIGEKVKQWHSDLTAIRLGPPPAPRAFVYNLSLWQDRRRQQPIDAFIRDVLNELNDYAH